MSESLHFSFLCPACQKSLSFKHEATSVIICNHCKAVIHKSDHQKSRDTLAFFEEDMSILRIETTGNINGKDNFEIIGRIKIEHNNGFYNLWCVKLIKTNTFSWILESMGYYSFCTIDNNHELNIKQLISKRAGHDFAVEKIGTFKVKQQIVIDNYNAEGEFENISLLLKNANCSEICLNGQIIFCISYNNTSAPVVFLGKYYAYENFAFKNTRYKV